MSNVTRARLSVFIQLFFDLEIPELALGPMKTQKHLFVSDQLVAVQVLVDFLDEFGDFSVHFEEDIGSLALDQHLLPGVSGHDLEACLFAARETRLLASAAHCNRG